MDMFQCGNGRYGNQLQTGRFLGIVTGGAIALMFSQTPTQALPEFQIVQTTPVESDLCPAPVLSRLTQHTVVAGETVESIATQYGLIPATVIGFNPSLQNGTLTIGSTLVIPPYNGIQVQVPSGSTWQDLASQYSIQADVLFEVNGCQAPGNVAFIPGVNWSPVSATTATPEADASDLPQYPLALEGEVITEYGWQVDPASGAVVFNSGVDIQVPAGTSVLAAGDGVVAFAGTQDNYGNLVVINHRDGLQTRYAQLSSIQVQQGDSVSAGDAIGTVGTASDMAIATLATLHFETRLNSSLGWVAKDPSTYFDSLRFN
jgi:murein DD-endopeptidase MepM/ murein hydrolase activator NlpD